MGFPRAFATPNLNEPTIWVDLGRASNDTLTGNAQANTLNGGIGNDRLNGLGGNDALRGGSGRDQLNGGDGNDKLQGASGSDNLNGASGNDSLFGGAGADTLNGGAGNDLLQGGLDNDLYKISTGRDVIYDLSGDNDHLNMGAIGFESLTFSVLDVVDGSHHLGSDGMVDSLLIRGVGFQLMVVNYFDNSAERAGDTHAGDGLIESLDFRGVSVDFDTIQLLVANLEPDNFS